MCRCFNSCWPTSLSAKPAVMDRERVIQNAQESHMELLKRHTAKNAHEFRLNIFHLQSRLAQLWGFQKDFIFSFTRLLGVFTLANEGGPDPACVLQWVGRPLHTQQPRIDTPERAEAAGCRLFITDDCRGRWQIFIFEQIAVQSMHTKQAPPFTGVSQCEKSAGCAAVVRGAGMGEWWVRM